MVQTGALKATPELDAEASCAHEAGDKLEGLEGEEVVDQLELVSSVDEDEEHLCAGGHGF